MQKNILTFLGVVVVVIALVYVLNTPKQTSVSEEEIIQPVINPENPNFFSGEIVSFDGKSILQIKSGQETYLVNIGQTTKLEKLSSYDGTLVVNTAELSDFVEGAQVSILYFEGSGKELITAGAVPIKIQVVVQ